MSDIHSLGQAMLVILAFSFLFHFGLYLLDTGGLW